MHRGGAKRGGGGGTEGSGGRGVGLEEGGRQNVGLRIVVKRLWRRFRGGGGGDGAVCPL